MTTAAPIPDVSVPDVRVPEPPMTDAEFERWAMSYEGPKCELVEGRIVQQAVTTKRHARIVMNIARALGPRLDLDVWAVMAETVAVKPAGRTRLPDLVVERVDAEGSSMVALAPVLLVEVLSPSSVATDLVDKVAEYTSLPTLEAYLIASQDVATCWIWLRDETRAFPRSPHEVDRLDGVLPPIPVLDVALPLAEIYRGIGVV